MLELIVLGVAFILGAVMGSFMCCQVRRMRLREEGKKALGKWSVCLNCGKRLEWYENIPVVSWLVLRGKCAKCGAKIGWMEILSEIGLGVVFVLLVGYFGFGWFESGYGLFGGSGLVGSSESLLGGGGDLVGSGGALIIGLQMVAILAMVVGMWGLLLYDAKWGRLPNLLLIFVNVCAIIYLILRVVGWSFGGPSVDFLGVFYAVGILAGIYYLLYFFSHEKWVGGGDWLVALAIAVVLADWFLALVVLFVANLLASVLGIFVIAKRGRKAQVPFGPFLVVAFVVTFLAQNWLLSMLVF